MRARVVFYLLGMVFLVLGLASCRPRIQRLPTPTRISGPSRPTPIPPRTTPQPALLERRELVLEWPETIREKDSDWITLSIVMDEAGQATATVQTPGHSGEGTPVNIPDLYATHNIVAVARLDMAGMAGYESEIRQPLSPGKPVVFRWSIRAEEAGIYRGVIWLHLQLVPKQGGAIDEMLLLSRPIEVRAITVFGLSGSMARFLGGAGVFLSAVLGYPFVQKWIENRFKRRKSRKSTLPAQAKNMPEPNSEEDVSRSKK